jgi:hypothetical protein
VARNPTAREVNFRDERYLPFEGAGVISAWQIDMPRDCNAFNFETITDVIIALRYTARYGGDRLRDIARKAAVLPSRPVQSYSGSTTPLPNQKDLQRLFSLKHEFPTEWYKFLHPADTASGQSMQIALGNERFPYQYWGKTIQISQVELVLLFSNADFSKDYGNGGPLVLELGPPDAASPSSAALAPSSAFLNGTAYVSIPQPAKPAPSGPGSPPSWILGATVAAIANLDHHLRNPVTSGGTTYYHLNPDAIDDILMLCHFTTT